MCFFLFPWHIITCMYQNILPCISDDFMESKHPLSQCVPPHSGSSRVVAKLSATDPIVFVFNEVFVLFPKCKQQTIYLRWQNKLTWAKIDFDRQHWTSIMNEFYFFIFFSIDEVFNLDRGIRLFHMPRAIRFELWLHNNTSRGSAWAETNVNLHRF